MKIEGENGQFWEISLGEPRGDHRVISFNCGWANGALKAFVEEDELVELADKIRGGKRFSWVNRLGSVTVEVRPAPTGSKICYFMLLADMISSARIEFEFVAW